MLRGNVSVGLISTVDVNSCVRVGIQSFACLAILVANAFGSEPFQRSERGLVGVLHGEPSDQIIQLMGPDSSTMELPPIDPDRETFLSLRIVPGGGDLAVKIAGQTNVNQLVLYGTEVTPEEWQSLVDQCPDMRYLLIRRPVDNRSPELSDLTETERALLPKEKLSPECLAQIARFKNLKSLWINGFELPDDALEVLSSIEGLQELAITNSPVSDDSLKALEKYRRLDSLCLHTTQVRGEGLRHLKNSLAIQNLSVARSPVSGNFPECIRHLTTARISRLDISGTELPESCVAELREMFPFTKLVTDTPESISPGPHTKSAQVTREHHSAIALLADSKTACLGFTSRDADSDSRSVRGVTINPRGVWKSSCVIPFLGMVQTLESLTLQDCVIPPGSLATLTRHPELRHICLENSTIQNGDLEHLTEVPNLEYLILKGTVIGDQGARFIGRCRGLTNVSLEGTLIRDVGVAALSQIPSIERLSLRDCLISDFSAGSLLQMRNLQELDLSGTQITDACLEQLSSHPALTRLKLHRCKISDKGAKAVLAIPTLQVLCVKDTEVTEDCQNEISLQLRQREKKSK